MKKERDPIKVTKDDTVSHVNKKQRTAPKTITATSRSTGPRKTGSDISRKGAKSQSNAQKESGISRSGASRVKNNPQTDSEFTHKKDRNI